MLSMVRSPEIPACRRPRKEAVFIWRPTSGYVVSSRPTRHCQSKPIKRVRKKGEKKQWKGKGREWGRRKEDIKTAAWSLFITMNLNNECHCLRRECESWGGACRASASLLRQVCICHLPSLLWWWGSLQLCWRHVHFLVNLPFPLFVDEKRKKCDFLLHCHKWHWLFSPNGNY